MIEGRIAAVKLDGDIGPAGTMVLRFLEHLTKFPVIDTKTLERWLLLAQDVPGVTLSTVLEPSKEEPGALTLVAQVSLKRVAIPVRRLMDRSRDNSPPIIARSISPVRSNSSASSISIR